jgi:hypothetical protein
VPSAVTTTPCGLEYSAQSNAAFSIAEPRPDNVPTMHDRDVAADPTTQHTSSYKHCVTHTCITRGALSTPENASSRMMSLPLSTRNQPPDGACAIDVSDWKRDVEHEPNTLPDAVVVGPATVDTYAAQGRRQRCGGE